MSADISTEESVRDPGGISSRTVHWLVLTGDRHLIAAGMILFVVVGTYVLIGADVLAVGRSSLISTLLASGLASGMLTLITVALSINQLILSRVFASPNELSDRLRRTRTLREQVRKHAGEDRAPTDPASFLSMLARTLSKKADDFANAVDDGDWDAPAEVLDYASGIRDYGQNIDDRIKNDSTLVDVLDVVIGTEYANNMAATEHVSNVHGDDFPGTVTAELEAIDNLLESLAITRQFFKTLSLQTDLARLSRIIAYTGFFAIGTTVWLTLLYRTDMVMIPETWLPVVVSLGFGVIVAPLAVFISYILRSATIARQTVSVGPFVPPSEDTD